MTSELLFPSIFQYLATAQDLTRNEAGEIKLPPIDELARRVRVSRGKLREELVAAQAYGLVEMRPGDGTYILPFDFYTAVRTLVLYGLALDKENFGRFYALRIALETAFWDQAVKELREEDLEKLRQVLDLAEHKLRGTPIEIPCYEHREFHLRIFDRLDNEFVKGLLRAYWDAYEAVGLHLYFDLSYYEQMWASHRAIVEAIAAGRYDEGKKILESHFTMLRDRLGRDVSGG